MPCDLSPDDPQPQGELPAESHALGDRLAAEAAALARVFPAREPDAQWLASVIGAAAPANYPEFPSIGRVPARPRSWFGLRLAIGGGLVVAASLSLLVVLRWREHPVAPELPGLVSVPNVTTPPGVAPLAAALRARPEAALAAPVLELPPQPAVLLNASGPQLEGLFDLWERDRQPVAQVAF